MPVDWAHWGQCACLVSRTGLVTRRSTSGVSRASGRERFGNQSRIGSALIFLSICDQEMLARVRQSVVIAMGMLAGLFALLYSPWLIDVLIGDGVELETFVCLPMWYG